MQTNRDRPRSCDLFTSGFPRHHSIDRLSISDDLPHDGLSQIVISFFCQDGSLKRREVFIKSPGGTA